MIRFSRIVDNLISVWLLTGNTAYVVPVLKYVLAWFMDEQIRMNPHLLYAQAIKGVSTGRDIGIIDTIHLIEVVQSLIRLEEKGFFQTKCWKEPNNGYGGDEMSTLCQILFTEFDNL